MTTYYIIKERKDGEFTGRVYWKKTNKFENAPPEDALRYYTMTERNAYIDYAELIRNGKDCVVVAAV